MKTNCKAHVTIENVEKLAKKIAASCNISIDEARPLAEFNLNYSESCEQAAARV